MVKLFKFIYIYIYIERERERERERDQVEGSFEAPPLCPLLYETCMNEPITLR